MNQTTASVDLHDAAALRAAITGLIKKAGVRELVFVYVFLSSGK